MDLQFFMQLEMRVQEWRKCIDDGGNSNEVMGRVDSLFRLIGTGIRIVLLMLFTAGVSKAGVMLPFYVLSCILIFSLGIAIYYVLSQRKVAANVSNKSIV